MGAGAADSRLLLACVQLLLLRLSFWTSCVWFLSERDCYCEFNDPLFIVSFAAVSTVFALTGVFALNYLEAVVDSVVVICVGSNEDKNSANSTTLSFTPPPLIIC